MEYCEIGSQDLETIAILSERHLTHGKKILDDIRQHRLMTDYFGVKAVEQDQIIGFYTCIEGRLEFTLPHPEAEREIRKIIGDKKIVTGDTLYVDPAYRGRGIASELSRRVTEMARKRGGKFFLTEAWIHPDGIVPARKIVPFNGDVVYRKILPGFYRDLYKYGMECPICGRDCVCGAEVELHIL
ncbi:MAG: GNAT family N-acetyltransferase [Blautia sp.]|nr:GNAT family N-acetyltransferase [Blautia sp.]